MQTLDLIDYQIFVGDFWPRFHQFLDEKKYAKIVILADDNTARDCYEPYRAQWPEGAVLVQVRAGEVYKNVDTCQDIWRALFAVGADRRSLLINLGGGVIGDMGGFCAATFKRGFDFVQMPTTLLSQVDASIGGKLGIDFGQVKNSIGVFANPKAVFISPAFLKTVSPREIRSGFAEIAKHALIADTDRWHDLQAIDDLSGIDWLPFLVPSLKIKQKIVTLDPFEKGLRKALNFGHTIGHAIESCALDSPSPLTHGEAIAIGMIAEAYLSHILRGLPVADLTAIVAFFKKHYPPYDISVFSVNTLLDLMRQDKKNDEAGINFSLLPAIGQVVVNETATPAAIIEALDFYQKNRF